MIPTTSSVVQLCSCGIAPWVCNNAVGWHLVGVQAQLQLVHIVGLQHGSIKYTREDLLDSKCSHSGEELHHFSRGGCLIIKVLIAVLLSILGKSSTDRQIMQLIYFGLSSSFSWCQCKRSAGYIGTGQLPARCAQHGTWVLPGAVCCSGVSLLGVGRCSLIHGPCTG